ncbi:MAG: hypothetical protein COB51_08150 [Moraxellaceae bacterium]|nr:MAG: hypothetical protein COB51_08150 [Moraxellaceae bacterium]
MSLKEKEVILDEIYVEQPNLLGSVVVLNQMGSTLEQMEVLLNILLVAYLALNESGIKIAEVTESEQERELSRFVGHVKFTEGLSSSSELTAIQQYIESHEEKTLLAYVYKEMLESGFHDLKYESSKYLIIAGFNIVNCISAAEIA